VPKTFMHETPVPTHLPRDHPLVTCDYSLYTLAIELVARCPIHAVPLVDACPGCSDGFGMRITGLAVPPESCRCRRTVLLDPRVARLMEVARVPQTAVRLRPVPEVPSAPAPKMLPAAHDVMVLSVFRLFCRRALVAVRAAVSAHGIGRADLHGKASGARP
jgi:hypothetical protein